jgi:hypothetical protein
MMAPIHATSGLRPFFLNGLPPVITRVCQESRAVAYECEGWPDSYGEVPTEADWVCSTNGDIRIANNFWLDYKRDLVNLNWLPYYGLYYGNGSGSVLMHLAWHAKKLGRRPSIMAECLIDCFVPENEDEMWDIFELLRTDCPGIRSDENQCFLRFCRQMRTPGALRSEYAEGYSRFL